VTPDCADDLLAEPTSARSRAVASVSQRQDSPHLTRQREGYRPNPYYDGDPERGSKDLGGMGCEIPSACAQDRRSGDRPNDFVVMSLEQF